MSAALVRIVVPLSLLALLVAVTEAGLLPHKVHEVVINNLPDNKTLILHCYKRKGKDLGVTVLRSGATFEFTFRPRLIGSTKYYCSFQWRGVFYWFDLYTKHRDHKKCKNCSWSVREEAICRFNYNTHAFSDCYYWKKI
ncbi:Plant self-incompatibility protein S1 [Sesbania bispinosa]|nr:Plant self-incompatibility protein S1 [Sesbania bispinosa]